MADDQHDDAPEGHAPPPIETALDLAFERARADEDETAGFYDALFATTVYLPIRGAYDEDGNESDDDASSIEPLFFEVEDEPTLLIFDTEERLARWAAEPMHYVGLPGHAFFRMFEGGQQVGVNISVAPSSVLIPSDVVGWLHERAVQAPEAEDVPAGAALDVTPPPALPPEAVARITARLAGLRSEVHEAVLFSLAIDAADDEEDRRVVLGVALTEGGVDDSEAVAAALAETTRGAFENKRPFEVAILDPASPLMETARRVGQRLPIVDMSTLH